MAGVRWVAVSVSVAAGAFAAWAHVPQWGWFVALAVVLASLAVAGDYTK